MRLSEAAGLLTSDIILDTEIPHINLVNHPWRRLKTKGSNRVIPLIGSSLWAAKRVLKQIINMLFQDILMKKSVMLTQLVMD